MKVKTITYQRVLNLGNYESKRLEMTIEVDAPQKIAEVECSKLMESVEWKIREDASREVVEVFNAAKQELSDLYRKIEEAQQVLAVVMEGMKSEKPDTEILFDSEVSEGGDF